MRVPHRLRNRLTALGLSLLSLTAAANQYDLALLGGRVIDPETGLDAVRNVGISDNRIAVITTESITAKASLNVAGLVVSPGFIDMHAHGQSTLTGRVQAFDGVTTALELESGTYPIDEYYRVREQEGRPINYGASVNWLSARIATLTGLDPSSDAEWFARAMEQEGWQDTIATPAQLESIQQMIAQGLDEGGLGVGFLTGYAPGSGYKEYYAVNQLAAERQVPTFTHARYLSMAEPASSFEAIQEIIGVAASTGVHAHIVHLNSISLKDINLIGPMITQAQQRGVQLSTEAYPYGAGATSIGAAMFKGENWRERIGNISAENFAVDGRRLSEDEFAQLQRDKPSTDIIIHFLETDKPEEQQLIDRSILMPGGVIASDGGDWVLNGESLAAETWPLPAQAWSHPRSAGTFARFIKHYVRDTQQLSLLEAIAKVSYLPAKLLEQASPDMQRKGRIQVGSDADIVVFKLAELQDSATYDQPAGLSQGVKHLLVNGTLLIENGQLNTAVLPGQAVRNHKN